MTFAESPGSIALPTSEVGRFALFTSSLAATRQPANCMLRVMCSASITENLNQIIRELRDEDEWVWVIGDDHCWLPDCLERLLEQMDEHDLDVLVPLVTKRNPPWHLVLFHDVFNDDGSRRVDEHGIAVYDPWNWEDVPASGVFEVDAAGSAGMLVRRRVLDAMRDPWFENTNGVVLNEDVNFCQKARALGFKVYATADVAMGHIGIFRVWPLRRSGRWGALTEFSSSEDQYRALHLEELMAEAASV